MTVKEHYERHLGNFYSWITGDFSEKQGEQQRFFELRNLLPQANKVAFDLGAGHGLQSISLAKLGFSVTAVDFNRKLLQELHQNKGKFAIETVNNDIIQYLNKTNEKAELIVCMGDTLTHLENLSAVNILISEIERHLVYSGKVVLSFRDLSTELKGEQRFILVKNDDKKILTCFLEYFTDHVMVHDILHEKENGLWVQKVSSYPKLRLSERMVIEMLGNNDLELISCETINRMTYVVAAQRKQATVS
jgi:2-polyprenyl-3-methyl-5-hydroxy-6-metoxy-1,4-benzoquinol methylase